jgi:hypothetical protein
MPPELFDARLLDLFSNGFGGFTKSLEEIDQIDTGRMFRALEAKAYEQAHSQWYDPDVHTKDKSPKTYKLVLEMDRIINGLDS